jgi:DNA-binding transcriptional MerR regulator
MPIGEFARRSRLPASTLRYYHQLGLLEPARLDRSTGYRYYAPEQLATAALVAELRRMGVRPAAIAAVLAGCHPPQGDVARGGSDLAAVLADERGRIEAEIRDRRQALAGLDALLARLGAVDAPEVVVADVPARTVTALRGRVRSEDATADVRRLVAGLRGRLRAAGWRAPLHYGAAFPLDLVSDPVPATVFAVPAAAEGGELPPAAGLVRMELAAARRAAVVHHGDLVLAPAYSALLGHVAALGLRPAGPVVEEYGGTAASPSTTVSVALPG